jgi:cytochrome c6
VDNVTQRLKNSIIYIALPAILLAAFSMTIAITVHGGAPAAGGGDARTVYNSKCASCHGRDGRATSARAKREHARDMTTGDWQDSVSDERIYNSISNGKGKMPAFKKKLSDAQIDELVNYVRRLRR